MKLCLEDILGVVLLTDKVCILTSSLQVTSDAHKILEFVGYDVREVVDLSELLTERDIQMILIYNSSLKVAYEWVREIKTETDLRDLPILLMIRHKEYDILLNLYQIGILDFIEMPLMDIELISKVAISIELKKSREHVENLYRELKESLNLANQLQKLMLPPSIDLKSNIWLTGHYVPSEVVGGDIYDYFTTDGDVFLYIADISGHGLQSALLCSSIKSLFRSAMRRSDSIVKAVNELSDSMKTVLGYNYITGIFLKIKANGTVEYLNCGHPNIVVYDEVRFEEMKMKNVLPIGMFDYVYSDTDIGTFSIEDGKTYLLYSDGVYSGFDHTMMRGRSSSERFMDFLDKEISGIVPEILPFYIESRLRTIFSDLPDDFSFVCFGKTEDYCYYGDYDERINTSERSMVDMYNQVKKYALSDGAIILLNNHGRYKTLLGKMVEIGYLIKELPMSVSMTFDDISVMKLFI